MNTKKFFAQMVLAILVFVLVGCGETSSFEQAQQKNTIEAYQEYLAEYPQGRFADQARNTLDAMSFEQARQENTSEAYQEYLAEYPQGNFTGKAKDTIDAISFEQAQQENTIEAYQNYIKHYPQGKFAADARAAIRVLEFYPKVEEKALGAIEYFDKFRKVSDQAPSGIALLVQYAELGTLLAEAKEIGLEESAVGVALNRVVEVLTPVVQENQELLEKMDPSNQKEFRKLTNQYVNSWNSQEKDVMAAIDGFHFLAVASSE